MRDGGVAALSGYSTKQKKAIMNYFWNHPDDVVSAHELAAALQETHINMSTIYRNLAVLESNSQIQRCLKNGTREIGYCCMEQPCGKDLVRVKCTKCGKIFYMSEEQSELLLKYLAKNAQFSLDTSRTVLYGICSECKK